MSLLFNKFMQFAYLFILLAFFNSCNNKRYDNSSTTDNIITNDSIITNDNIELPETYRSSNEDSLKYLVVIKGDISAYNELSISYMAHNFEGENIYYSIVMANKYDYTQAYYDVYIYLLLNYTSDISSIDPNTANMAIDYLLQAAKHGHHQAIVTVEKHRINRDEDSKKQLESIYN